MRRTRRVRCVTSRAPGKHDTPSSSISFHTLPVLLPCQQRSSSMRVLRPDVTRRSTSSISLSISFYLFRFEIYLIFFPKKISVSRPPHEWCKNPSKKKQQPNLISQSKIKKKKKRETPKFYCPPSIQQLLSCAPAAHLASAELLLFENVLLGGVFSSSYFSGCGVVTMYLLLTKLSHSLCGVGINVGRFAALRPGSLKTKKFTHK